MVNFDENLDIMRLGIDCRMYGPQQTGIGTYIQYLIRNLLKLDKDNEYRLFFLKKNKSAMRQSFLLKTKSQTSKFIIHNSSFIIQRIDSPWYSLKEQTNFPLHLYKSRLDLMHFTHFNAPILYQKKFIVTIHDLTPMFWPGHKMGGSFLRKFAYGAVLKNVIYRSRAIITPSQFTKNDILKHFSVEPKKIFVIYEGIKNKPPKAQREYFISNIEKKKENAKNELKEKFFLNLSFPYILYVGVWRNHKNLTGLIRAFHAIKTKKQIPHKLVICGKEDPYYPEIKATIKNLKLEKDIFLAGLVTGKKLNLIYRGADAYILPSFYEGFGLTPLEAISQGTPVAVSKIGPMPEILGNGALFFNPNNTQDIAEKIYNLLNNKSLQKDLLLKGKNMLKRYNWKEMARKTLEVYQDALADRF